MALRLKSIIVMLCIIGVSFVSAVQSRRQVRVYDGSAIDGQIIKLYSAYIIEALLNSNNYGIIDSLINRQSKLQLTFTLDTNNNIDIPWYGYEVLSTDSSNTTFFRGFVKAKLPDLVLTNLNNELKLILNEQDTIYWFDSSIFQEEVSLETFKRYVYAKYYNDTINSMTFPVCSYVAYSVRNRDVSMYPDTIEYLKHWIDSVKSKPNIKDVRGTFKESIELYIKIYGKDD